MESFKTTENVRPISLVDTLEEILEPSQLSMLTGNTLYSGQHHA